MKEYILAHDLGTTGNKATLYNKEGKLVGSAFSGYETVYAHAGWAEQDPTDWWRAVCESTRQLIHKSAIDPDSIACITFSGQMMGCVPLDEHAQPLRNAIIWADTRAVAQADQVGQRISPAEVYAITGHRLSSSYSLAKMLWIRDNQPEIYAATHKFVHAKDAMIARLTGTFATEPSDASGMNLYDLEAGVWSQKIIDAAQIDPAQLPDILPSTAIAGGVLAAVAEEIGLPTGTPVVMGGGDGSCAAVGAGVVAAGSAYSYVGSSSWIAIASAKPIYDPDFRTFTFAHVLPRSPEKPRITAQKAELGQNFSGHMYMPVGTMQAAGASYQWVRNELCTPEMERAADNDENVYDLLNQLAAEVAAGSDGLIYLPYLMGERSPRWNPDARGAFIGLTVRHSRAHMIRATLEGVTLNLNVILDALRKQGAQIDAMRVIGGGAQGQLWNQIMADIYNMPVQRLAILEEATSMGAAVVGGVGIGLYPDFEMAVQMNEIAQTVVPNPQNRAVYDALVPIFDDAYDALVPLFEQLGKVELL